MTQVWIIGVAVILSLAGCSDGNLVTERAKRVMSNPGKPLLVGIVWPANSPDGFLDGVRMAQKQINERGGVLGRTLELLVVDEDQQAPPKEEANRLANEFADHDDLAAVIGHRSSSVAIPASITYEQNGILYIAPSSTVKALTNHNFNRVIRTIPNTDAMAEQLVGYAERKSYRKLAVMWVRSRYAEEVTAAFEKYAAEKQLDIVFRKSFFSQREDFRAILAGLLPKHFDALFVVGDSKVLARLAVQCQEMGIDAPFLAAEGVRLKAFKKMLGEDRYRTEVKLHAPILYDPDEPRLQVHAFNALFQKNYGRIPDSYAAQGYDAVNVLVAAIEQSGSAVPTTVAITMKYNFDWEGVTGPYQFNSAGDIPSKKFKFATLARGKMDIDN